jgi:hypothetical protein
VANAGRCSLYSILCLWKPYIMFMETLHSTLYRKSRGKSRPMFLLYIAVGINSLRTSRCMTGVHTLSPFSLSLSLSLTHKHIHIHIHIYIYIHTYTYIHIYIYTHIYITHNVYIYKVQHRPMELSSALQPTA